MRIIIIDKTVIVYGVNHLKILIISRKNTVFYKKYSNKIMRDKQIDFEVLLKRNEDNLYADMKISFPIHLFWHDKVFS